jgi:type IV pilus assembly protein PilV
MRFRQCLRRAPRRQLGVGLIEVLIAILIMAVGMLGIAAMQATALRNSQSSLDRSQAVIEAYSILDAMRANRDRALAGDYNIALSTSCAGPTGTTQAALDLISWRAQIQKLLGATACGEVAQSKPNGTDFTVTMRWDDSRGKAGKLAETIVTSTQL